MKNMLDFKPYLSFIVTNACNFRCVYCTPTEDGGMGEGLGTKHGKVEVEDITAKIVIAAEEGIEKIRLTGGEPFAFNGTIPILRFLEHETDLEYVVSTNGSLIHKRFGEIDELKRLKLRVSLDTTDRNKFNEISRTKAYDQTMSNIEFLAKQGSLDRFSMVVTKDNVDDVKGVIKLCMRLGLNLKLLDVYQTPETKLFWQESYSGMDEVREMLRKMSVDIGDAPYTMRYGIPSIDFFIPIEGRSEPMVVRVKDSRNGTRYSPEYCSGCEAAPCQEGMYTILHATDGSMLPCRFAPKQFNGNGLENFRKSLREILGIYARTYRDTGFWHGVGLPTAVER